MPAKPVKYNREEPFTNRKALCLSKPKCKNKGRE